jgi:chaperonin GroES
MAEATLSKVKVEPLGDRVLVQPLEQKEVKKGGIIIPDTAKEKPQEGKVISTGKGKVSDEGKVLPMDVKAGDRVLYGKYSGTEIKIDDQDYIIMHQDDILGILR